MDGFDLTAIARLAKVRIGVSPLPGRTLRIGKTLVMSRLRPVINPQRLELIVPENAQVVRVGQILPGGEIARIVLDYAMRDSGKGKGNLHQELITPLRDVVLPKGVINWQMERIGKHLVAGGNRTYRITAFIEGSRVWHQMVRVRQKVYQKIVVAARSIRRNQVIGPRDVRMERKNTSALRGAPFLVELAKVVGKHATRPIGQGEILHKGLVAAAADIKEGGRIIVLYQSSRMTIKSLGVALVSGRVGQFIPVRNLQSGKIVYGIVQPNETVKVN